MKEHYNWKMLSSDLPVEISLFLKYINDLQPDSDIDYEMLQEIFYQEVMRKKPSENNNFLEWTQ